ncbi:HEAT repeat domain-containing protein [Acetivibrio clariflavus]|uniref:HEAT repeat-containing protein n=1 Tax=Acetivibrio clariflavus (strain DSM 19732 / NBRC 101661 / EBR45) TaxID=720554 RepID=G8LTD6_ACECE|nr:HEAT repeat domain-containing protein [Acetivibrio clariflavus]AEV68383.1 hypothetical protein Clocl_1774 [Acetivibrio clariflavus DSM 19732]
MEDKYKLGLFLDPGREKLNAIKYLSKTALAKYQTLLYKLIDCIYDIQNNKVLTQSHLSLLEEGMRQPLELIFSEYSGKYAAKLSHNFNEPKELFYKLANDSNSKIRFNAVTLMLCKPTEDVIEYVLSKCVNDKSSSVRRKVADVCCRLNQVKMIGILENQFALEKNESVRRSMDFSIRLLRDGYILEEKDTDMCNLLVETCEGEILGVILKKSVISEFGIKAIVEMIRRNGGLPSTLS